VAANPFSALPAIHVEQQVNVALLSQSSEVQVHTWRSHELDLWQSQLGQHSDSQFSRFQSPMGRAPMATREEHK
jgi:hypothetical protein